MEIAWRVTERCEDLLHLPPGHSEVCVIIPEWLLEVKGTESDANLQSMASGRNKVILNKFANARHDWVDCHIII